MEVQPFRRSSSFINAFTPFGTILQPYQAMYALYNIVKEMPTHDASKPLLKKKRMRLDLEHE